MLSRENPPRRPRVKHPRPSDPFFKAPVAVAELTADQAHYVAVDLLRTALVRLRCDGQDEAGIWRLARVLGYVAKDLDADQLKKYVLDSIDEGRRGELVL